MALAQEEKKQMKKGKLFAVEMLLALVATVLFSSCARTPETQTQTNIAPTPTPEVKMEGQSTNWKIVVLGVNKVPKQDSMHLPMQPTVEGPENKYDTLHLTVEVAYTGPPNDVHSPSATMIDSNGRKLEAVKTALDTPGAIYMVSYGPDYSSLETLFTGETDAPTPSEAERDQKGKEAKELLDWLDPQGLAYNKKPRALKAGEKFTTIYMFQDPKEYANLKFVFNDVAPITLKAPQEEKEPPK